MGGQHEGALVAAVIESCRDQWVLHPLCPGTMRGNGLFVALWTARQCRWCGKEGGGWAHLQGHKSIHMVMGSQGNWKCSADGFSIVVEKMVRFDLTLNCQRLCNMEMMTVWIFNI